MWADELTRSANNALPTIANGAAHDNWQRVLFVARSRALAYEIVRNKKNRVRKKIGWEVKKSSFLLFRNTGLLKLSATGNCQGKRRNGF